MRNTYAGCALILAVCAAFGAVYVLGLNATDPTTKLVTVPPKLPTPANGEKDIPTKGHANYRPASGCGIERWAVKTLTDPGANAVNPTPKPTTIAALVALPAPVNPTDRVAPVETTTWTVHGTLTYAVKEKDSDYHLVIADQGKTMIVELPDPKCASGSTVLKQIASVRSHFERAYGIPRAYPAKPLTFSKPVTVTGPALFDRLHGQHGVAPNGIELHPVTGLGP